MVKSMVPHPNNGESRSRSAATTPLSGPAPRDSHHVDLVLPGFGQFASLPSPSRARWCCAIHAPSRRKWRPAGGIPFSRVSLREKIQFPWEFIDVTKSLLAPLGSLTGTLSSKQYLSRSWKPCPSGGYFALSKTSLSFSLNLCMAG